MKKITRTLKVAVGTKEGGEIKTLSPTYDNINQLSKEGYKIEIKELLMGIDTDKFIEVAEVLA